MSDPRTFSFERNATILEMAAEMDRRGAVIEKLERTLAARDRRIARLVAALDYARSQGVIFPGDDEPPVVLSAAYDPTVQPFDEPMRHVEAVRQTPETIYKAVERVLDEHSAWIARPNQDVTKAVALAAGIAWSLQAERQQNKLVKCAVSHLPAGHPNACNDCDPCIGHDRATQLAALMYDWERLYWEVRRLQDEEAGTDPREAVASWMLQHSYATGHGDTLEDLLSELEAQAKERTACQGGSR